MLLIITLEHWITQPFSLDACMLNPKHLQHLNELFIIGPDPVTELCIPFNLLQFREDVPNPCRMS